MIFNFHYHEVEIIYSQNTREATILKLLHWGFTVLSSASAILRKIGKRVFWLIKAKKMSYSQMWCMGT